MKVFISWSGPQSKLIAETLRTWLPKVIQAVKPWVSGSDIEKGESWLTAIQDSLAGAKGMGIFCLTPDNLTAPWLAFEAGAISSHDRSRVATFLLNVEPSGLKPPLSLFQATNSHEKVDVFALVKTINGRLDEPLEPQFLESTFETFWNELATSLTKIRNAKKDQTITQLDSNAVLGEILSTVRRLERDSAEATEMRLRQAISGSALGLGAVRPKGYRPPELISASDLVAVDAIRAADLADATEERYAERALKRLHELGELQEKVKGSAGVTITQQEFDRVAASRAEKMAKLEESIKSAGTGKKAS